uniref:Uncharacterized protein n=1 Tax=Panagrellus redivivus TaxID=6233 RepID=A0A7E4UV08_PANRE
MDSATRRKLLSNAFSFLKRTAIRKHEACFASIRSSASSNKTQLTRLFMEVYRPKTIVASMAPVALIDATVMQSCESRMDCLRVIVDGTQLT